MRENQYEKRNCAPHVKVIEDELKRFMFKVFPLKKLSYGSDISEFPQSQRQPERQRENL